MIFLSWKQYNIMSGNIQEKCVEYLSLNAEMIAAKSCIKKLKQRSDALEKDIQMYMTKENMDSVNLEEGEIVLYKKKISQNLKRDAIREKLAETLQDSEKAEQLTQCILANKKFITKDKVKVVNKS